MRVKKNILSYLIGLCILPACSNPQAAVQETVIIKPANTHFALSDFYKDDSALLKKTDSVYNSLSNTERAAQLIMPATGVSKKFGLPFSNILKLYKQRMIGGVLFLKGTRELFRNQIKELNDLSKTEKKMPLVFSCDCEPTLFHRKFTDADSMTVASSLITNEQVKNSAVAISKEMQRMGIQWNFAPVADMKSEKSIINERSFSSDGKKVVSNSITFIQSSMQENIAATIKHFPGHGEVMGDSHNALVYIDSSLQELNNFREIISGYAPISVMMGHIAIKNSKSLNTGNLPSSLSSKIINDVLRDSFKFKGIVITDAMSMGAVKNIPNADYLAILAGNDVVLMPQHAGVLNKRIVAVLQKNNAQGLQVVHSVKKILRLKICLGIIN